MKIQEPTTTRSKAPQAPEPSETQEQQAVLQWWASYAPTKGIDERLLFAIPNGSVLAGDSRHRAIQMARLKREGLRVGVPDLMLAWPKHGICSQKTNDATISWSQPLFFGLYVELKRKGGKASPDQLEMADLLRRAGYSVVIAIGFDEARQAIVGYLG